MTEGRDPVVSAFTVVIVLASVVGFTYATFRAATEVDDPPWHRHPIAWCVAAAAFVFMGWRGVRK